MDCAGVPKIRRSILSSGWGLNMEDPFIGM
jgi:hypothetical protein